MTWRGPVNIERHTPDRAAASKDKSPPMFVNIAETSLRNAAEILRR
jgi:hypothetical protein